MNDPISILNEWCEFGTERVYVLLGIARKKENPNITQSSQPAIRIVIREKDEIERKYEQLKHAVSRFDKTFRIYVTVNARDTISANFNFQQEMQEWEEKVFRGNEHEASKEKFKQVDSEWKSQLVKKENKADNYFMFDLDETSEKSRDGMIEDIEEGGGNVKLVTESPNGWHIISEPFNFNNVDSDKDYELKKDDMLFLELIK